MELVHKFTLFKKSQFRKGLSFKKISHYWIICNFFLVTAKATRLGLDLFLVSLEFFSCFVFNILSLLLALCLADKRLYKAGMPLHTCVCSMMICLR